MPRSRKQPKSYNGFAIPLQPDTELGMAMLIAEDEEGRHEPVAVASTINEAKELAESNLRSRMRRLERGDDPGIGAPPVHTALLAHFRRPSRHSSNEAKRPWCSGSWPRPERAW